MYPLKEIKCFSDQIVYLKEEQFYPGSNDTNSINSLKIFHRNNFLALNKFQKQNAFFYSLIRFLKLTNNPTLNKIANRLITLFNDSKAEEPDNVGIQIPSLTNFINFLKMHPNIKYPSISLTPDLNIYVSWRENNKRVLSIHFLQDNSVRFVIFTTNSKYPEKKTRIFGSTTTDELIKYIIPFNLSDLIFQ